MADGANLRSFCQLLNTAKQMESVDQQLNFVCSQLECFDNFLTDKSIIRKMCSRAINQYFGDAKFRGNDHLLRVFSILAKHSANMGETGIFDELENLGYFKESEKFHLMWAEAHAKGRNVQKFREIIARAQQRLSAVRSSELLNAPFRDLAEQYGIDVTGLFNEEDEQTVAIFKNYKRNRRRSSVAFLEKAAAVSPNVAPVKPVSHGPGVRLMVNPLYSDRDADGYIGISPEEFRAAKFQDTADLGDDMDITCDLQPPVEEKPKESNKRRSIMRAPLGLSTITEPSREDSREKDSLEKIEQIETQHHEQPAPRVHRRSQPSPAVGTSFTSNFYSQAISVFSNTVDLQKQMQAETATPPPVEHEPVEDTAPAAVNRPEEFQVLVDEEGTFIAATSPAASTLLTEDVEMKQEERRPLAVIQPPSAVHPARNTEPKPFLDDEDTVMGGFGMPARDKCFITSTPAPTAAATSGRNPTDLFFLQDNEDGVDEDADPFFKSSASSAFAKKRQSMGNRSSQQALPVILPQAKKGLSERPALEVGLGRLSLGGANEPECDYDLNKTGVGLPEQVESEVNPWDPAVRQKIMDVVIQHPLVIMHDLGAQMCPRVEPGRVIDLGGEQFKVVKLLGQGNFAKVFKCTNEEEKEVALKYEIPPCAWEAYICEELRLRLQKDPQVLRSFMQVDDAFIFKNASVLVNEYHSMGTLLDLSNSFKDPPSILHLFVAIQIAFVLNLAHSAQIIHGDVKPDNFLIISKLPETNVTTESVLATRVLKLIDWGRAIDMKALEGHSFKGRAGTDKFDCPQMLDGRPWSYHTDYYGFLASVHVVMFNKYMDVKQDANDQYQIAQPMKRRWITCTKWPELADFLLNHAEPSPDFWTPILNDMCQLFIDNFDETEWKKAASKFNQCLPSV